VERAGQAPEMAPSVHCEAVVFFVELSAVVDGLMAPADDPIEDLHFLFVQVQQSVGGGCELLCVCRGWEGEVAEVGGMLAHDSFVKFDLFRTDSYLYARKDPALRPV